MREPSKPTVDPLISITLQPVTLRFAVALITALGLLLIGSLGIASSPFVDGHPVLLSPERLAIKTYLDAARGWLQRLTEIDRQLVLIDMPPAAASSTVPTSTVITARPIVTGGPLAMTVTRAIPLPTLAPPDSWPSNLYDRAQQADWLVADLAALDANQQRIEVPPALAAVNTLARSSVQAFARWSTAALDVIGAPTPDNLKVLQSSRDAARKTLGEFRRALAAQRQEVR